MNTVITVDNLGKKYSIRHQQRESYYTFRDMLVNLGKRSFESTEEFWAINNINLEIKEGERIGIIGCNGAGKSTFLKILSRITEPTTGRVKIRGRVASLLEVGTGFHQELTGRENIYLNGAILGMSRSEIRIKFDEIVEFAGTARFLDIPVKQYSSGMYMRLAFAVAAHLEADILLIDEVLSVGDAQFQKKCFGKMNDISKLGKTIIFVSHQMGMLGKLCDRVFLLSEGKLIRDGSPNNVIDYYMKNIIGVDGGVYTYAEQEATQEMYINKIQLLNSSKEFVNIFRHDEEISFMVEYMGKNFIKGSFLGFSIKDQWGRLLFGDEYSLVESDSTNHKTLMIKIPGNTLLSGKYFLTVAIYIPNINMIDFKEDIVSFSIIDVGSRFASYEGADCGSIFVKCQWESLD